MNTKLITVILVIIVLAVGLVAFSFYTQKNALAVKTTNLAKEKNDLLGEVNNLRYKFQQIESEKDSLSQKITLTEQELAKVEQEKNRLGQRLEELSQERDALVERLKTAPKKVEVVSTPQEAEAGSLVGASEEHWADFVKKKASLEAALSGLNQNLLDAKNKIAELENNNKELSIKIDELSKDKERFSEDINFKERTLRVMSMDLVAEREQRSLAVKEVKKLRSENMSLKRELVLANKEQIELQNSLKDIFEKKDALEKQINEAENILKEKSLAFDQLQERLKTAIAGGKKIVASETAAVELPPIVVTPTAPGLKGIRAEVIAVNQEENFVVVDAGEEAGLRPGAPLKAVSGDNEIAILEVIETRREISAADIVEVRGGFPLQEGDIVISR